jgi:hypothetical protein
MYRHRASPYLEHVGDLSRFVPPASIRASGGFVDEPEEIIEMLRQERGGLKEVTLLADGVRPRSVTPTSRNR